MMNTEFAKVREISDEPAFGWWVPYTLRTCAVILFVMSTPTELYSVEVAEFTKVREVSDEH